MRINVLQHTPIEGPGAIADWAHQHGHELYIYHPATMGTKLPKAANTDLLVLLGGPQSVEDRDDWILEERALIANMMEVGKPVLGICFGMQQIGKVMGAQIVKSHKEAGWGMIERQDEVIPGLPIALTAFHWHQEQCYFELPAIRQIKTLYNNEHTAQQAIMVGDNVVGLQFHLEVLPDDIREIVLNDGNFLKDTVYPQYPDELMAYPIPKANIELLYRILDYIVKR